LGTLKSGQGTSMFSRTGKGTISMYSCFKETSDVNTRAKSKLGSTKQGGPVGPASGTYSIKNGNGQR